MANFQFITFRLGDELFGINILLVREINKNIELTPVDGAPMHMRGLQNLRGQIVNVLDLGVKLGLGVREISNQSSYIVLKTLHELNNSRLSNLIEDKTTVDVVGFLVDKIGDVVEVDERGIEPVLSTVNGINQQFLSGVVKLDGELLMLLRVSEILDMEEVSVIS